MQKRAMQWSRRLALFGLALMLVIPSAHGKRKKQRAKEDKYAKEEADQVVDFGGLRAPGLQRWLTAFVDVKGQIKITRVDTSHAPRLDVHLSILEPDTELLTLSPMSNMERLDTLELLVASGDQSKVQPFLDYDVAREESLL